MLSGDEQAGYRLEALPDGSWAAVGLPGVTVVSLSGRRDALEAMRTAVAAVLEVPADAFDVEM